MMPDRWSFYNRFWSRVERRESQECWPWKGKLNSWGYGTISARLRGCRTFFQAHRVMLEMQGIEIDPGLVVMHKCDNPQCVNFSHLAIGTQTENMADMARKGRAAKGNRHWMRLHPQRVQGENNPRAKLTLQNVMNIREKFAAGGVTKVALAREFGVTDVMVGNIISGKSWTGGGAHS